MSIAELTVALVVLAGIARLLRPFSRLLENWLLKVFGKPNLHVINASFVRDKNAPPKD